MLSGSSTRIRLRLRDLEVSELGGAGSRGGKGVQPSGQSRIAIGPSARLVGESMESPWSLSANLFFFEVEELAFMAFSEWERRET